MACLFGAHEHKNTNGRVIYAALYVMILMWANPLQGPLEGWAMKIKTIYGNEHEASAIRAQESRDFQGPPRPIALVIDLPSSRGEGEAVRSVFTSYRSQK